MIVNILRHKRLLNQQNNILTSKVPTLNARTDQQILINKDITTPQQHLTDAPQASLPQTFTLTHWEFEVNIVSIQHDHAAQNVSTLGVAGTFLSLARLGGTGLFVITSVHSRSITSFACQETFVRSRCVLQSDVDGLNSLLLEVEIPLR